MTACKRSEMQPLAGGQLGFYFAPSCLASAEKLREQRKQSARESSRERRQAAIGSDAYLFEIIDFPESALTSEDLRQLDAYIAREAAKERSHWTPRREAQARGVDVGYQMQLINIGGRLFAGMTATEISLADFDFDYSADLE